VFYIADILFPEKRENLKRKLNSLGALLVFPFISAASLLWYNAARFADVFNNGYTSSENMQGAVNHRFELQNYGLFQLRNIPMNAYYYFLKAFDQTRTGLVTLKHPGTSFFFSSPVFLYIFPALRKTMQTRIVRLSLIPAAAVLPFLLAFYWPGMPQVGPRYLLDFLPFLYIILLHSFKKSRLSAAAKVLILTSAVLDYFLFIAIVSYQ
jgi:hypothetical protein